MYISVTCMWLMLICIAIVGGKIQWKVGRQVTGYGQDLVLFCEVENCCSDQAGWSVNNNPIYLDVRLIHGIEKAKYDATVNRTGFTLIIRNLAKDDLNKTYYCTHGFEDSQRKVLEEVDAFLSPVEDAGEADGGKEDGNKLPLIIGVCIGVIAFIILISLVGFYLWKRRKRRRNLKGSKKETQQLIEKQPDSTLPTGQDGVESFFAFLNETGCHDEHALS